MITIWVPKRLVEIDLYNIAARSPEALAAKLREVKNTELRAGFCLTGPHREDLEILIDGQPG